MAVVILQEIDAPLSIGARILLLVAERAIGACAGTLSSVGVDPELQPPIVDVVYDGLHSLGELLRVGLRSAIGSTLGGMP